MRCYLLFLRLKTLHLFCALLIFSSCAQTQTVKPEILWDHYGVPHIYGRTVEEMYYGFGWAQMHNHANLLLKLLGQARGKAAEYWGSDFVESDKEVHLFNLAAIARKTYSLQEPQYKGYLDAFVRGINDYAQKHPGSITKEMKMVLPVTPLDIMAHSNRVICLEFLGKEDIVNTLRSVSPGSNAYAIGPSRSASKRAMLVANPHLPWGDFFLFFEAHLNGPGFSAYGVSLIGQPALNIAFNHYLGWTHTVNTIDASDRYELILKDNGYLLDGKTELFDSRTDTLKIRQADGSLKEELVTFRYAKQGPVTGQNETKAYAVRIAGLDNAFLAAQYHKMASAQNWKEFESAVEMMQNPMFNIIYADKEGHIVYLFNGNVPKRAEGDWRFWHQTVDGTQSKYIWSQVHSYEDLPKVIDPATGFVQNANDVPWTCTYPPVLDPQNFPAYMSPQEEMEWRPQRAVNMIRKDPSITFDELVGYKLNTGMETAYRFLDDLLAAVQKHPDSIALRAAAVLKAWDRSTNTGSKGALLFTHWFDKLNKDDFLKPWNEKEPVTTPSGLKDPERAVALLVSAAKEVQQLYGRLEEPWGNIYRFHVGDQDYPANGGPAQYGIFRTMYFNSRGSKAYAVGGDTYVAVIEFGTRVRAQVLLSYGNATQPGSKHIGDQLPLLSQKKLRPALLDRREVEKNTEEREILVPSR
jgi:acyl-homoserine-lactone acylase